MKFGEFLEQVNYYLRNGEKGKLVLKTDKGQVEKPVREYKTNYSDEFSLPKPQLRILQAIHEICNRDIYEVKFVSDDGMSIEAKWEYPGWYPVETEHGTKNKKGWEYNNVVYCVPDCKAYLMKQPDLIEFRNFIKEKEKDLIKNVPEKIKEEIKIDIWGQFDEIVEWSKRAKFDNLKEKFRMPKFRKIDKHNYNKMHQVVNGGWGIIRSYELEIYKPGDHKPMPLGIRKKSLKDKMPKKPKETGQVVKYEEYEQYFGAAACSSKWFVDGEVIEGEFTGETDDGFVCGCKGWIKVTPGTVLLNRYTKMDGLIYEDYYIAK